jgi:hypothetical protein
VPGSAHQGLDPVYGPYVYTVTPRYFDDEGSLQPLDPALGVTTQIDVKPFETQSLKLGFTRGFTQSQAFVHHFGLKALIRPKGKDLVFDTSAVSGKNAEGKSFTFEDEYAWLGFTARRRIMEILEEVQSDRNLRLDVFAYDLNEPGVVQAFLALAAEGRIRIILDNATLHKTNKKDVSPEDEFERQFDAAKRDDAEILRGKFKRYAHDKVLVVSDGNGPLKILTGSTNFSVTGLYVNSNHVLVFDDRAVAKKYSEVFEAAWHGQVKLAAFLESRLSQEPFAIESEGTPPTSITFSPHEETYAEAVLGDIVKRVNQEGKKADGSVLFAVMQLQPGTGPVYPALQKLHATQKIFSYGISDTPGGISLYKPGSRNGVLVTGKPIATKLPPPFDQVRAVGAGHQIHHKFVVCGFNGDDPVVYCGSSNLALGGEEENGDNLIAVRDASVAQAFAIEALALVDHFQFLGRHASKAKKARGRAPKSPPANKLRAATSAGWFLQTSDKWARAYYDSKDLHAVDRELFG